MVSVPMRPAGFMSTLSNQEQDCLTWFVLSNCKKDDAYLMFINPALKASLGTLRVATNQLFDSIEAIKYVEEYKKTLQEFVSPKKESRTVYTAEENKRRKADAVSKLVDFVINEAEHINTAENPEDILKFADKLGLLESEEVVQESPRRYLPVRCSDCEYKKFIEENCKITE